MRTSLALKPLLHRLFGFSFMPQRAERAARMDVSILRAPPAEPQPTGPVDAPQCPDTQRQRHADEVGWLTSLQQDIEDQSARVTLRLERVKEDLAAGQAGAPRHGSQQNLRAIQAQVAALKWRQQALAERGQQVALRLQEARQRLAGLQGRRDCGDPAHARLAHQGH